MSDLERAYRKALARYPRAWRRNHEEALLGVLLDNAEAEGRHQMSMADHRDLAKSSRRLRTARIVPIVLFSVAVVLLLHAVALALNGVALGDNLTVNAPLLAQSTDGSSYYPYFLATTANVVYLVSLIVSLVAVVIGALLARRNVWINRAR